MKSAPLLIALLALAVAPLIGSGCPAEIDSNTNSADNSNSTDNSNSNENSAGDDGPAIAVDFAVSASVTTSLGTGGMDGLSVRFTASKYRWDSFEEEWVHKQTFEDTRITGTIDGTPGLTAQFFFGFNIHESESVFISAVCQSNGNTKEIRVNYSNAKLRAGDQTTVAYPYQFALVGDI